MQDRAGRLSDRVSGRVILRRMTDIIASPRPRKPDRLRLSSDRAVREMRLGWLLGHTAAAMAARLGCTAGTVRRHLRRRGLRGPEAPGERARLIDEALRDRLADSLLGGADAAKIAAALTKLDSPAPEAAPLKQDEMIDWNTLDAGALDRLVCLEPGLETKSARPEGGGRARPAAAALPAAGGGASLPGLRPRYAGAAAGPMAGLVAFGRTWGWEDARRSRMGALCGAAGGLPEAGAGGPDLCRSARGDDRGAERPGLD